MELNKLVLKIASRCNLNCSYCYMYNLGDNTYKNQPKVMSDSVVDKIIDRVNEYLKNSGGSEFQFIFHGGEPLLVSVDWFKSFVSKAKERLNTINLDFTLQTNGVLYNNQWATELDKLKISVGFSWDGPEKYHDKFRKYHNDKPSYQNVVKAMKIHKKKFGSLGGLSVMNAEVEPSIYYNNIKELGITNVSILFPHLHHSMSSEFHKFKYIKDEITYGHWLLNLFDLWWFDLDPDKPSIHVFIDFIGMILGHKMASESFGDQENDVLIIETNGGIESSSALKSIGNGFTKEGINIFNSSLLESLNSPLIQLFIKSHLKLPDQCENCRIKEICGGGRINQRFSDENQFDNPSVYCQDYKLIIAHIQKRLFENLSKNELDELNLEIINYDTL